MTRAIIFAAGTLGLLYFSRGSMKNPGVHGFYRFFAFEAILALILLNHPLWFADPFSPLHCLSWLLLAASIFFIINALLLLKQHGGHARREDAPENLSFENTVQVVDRGLYRYVRHPMYSSLLFLAWGAFLKNVTLLNIGLVLLATFMLLTAAKFEEKENLRFFGETYAAYMQRSRMFIPWIF